MSRRRGTATRAVMLLSLAAAGRIGLAAAGCADAGAPVGQGAPAPAAPADAAAPVDGGTPAIPPPGFMELPPCLQPERYIAGGTAVATVELTYQPACLRVSPGTNVTIQASALHPLEPGAGGSSDNPIPHQNTPVTITFSRPGFFPFFCPEHSDQNMRGVIWVTSP
jgi:plastocyanin